MKKIFLISILCLVILSSLAYAVGPNNPELVPGTNDGSFQEVKQLNFFEKLFYNINPFTVVGLSSSYTAGSTIHATAVSDLTTSCNSARIMVEMYSAPVGQETTSNLVNQIYSSLGAVGPGTYQYTFNMPIPTNAQTGTWSVSGYVWCTDISGPASNYNNPIQAAVNFAVTGTASCINDCTSGQKTCLTIQEQHSRYLGTCGNYDPDSCLEYPIYASQTTDCGGEYLCSNGACIPGPTTTATTTLPGTTSTTIPQTQSLIKVVASSAKLVGNNNQIEGTITLQNTGQSMTQDWVIEIQLNTENRLQSIVPIPSYQTVCDNSIPRNVHTNFRLNQGESKTITLVSPQIGSLSDATWYVIFVARKGCANDWQKNNGPIRDCNPTDNICNLITSDPTSLGGDGNGFFVQNLIVSNTGAKCGDGKCDPGEEGICLDDCKAKCVDDGFCSSIEVDIGICNDCSTVSGVCCLNSGSIISGTALSPLEYKTAKRCDDLNPGFIQVWKPVEDFYCDERECIRPNGAQCNLINKGSGQSNQCKSGWCTKHSFGSDLGTCGAPPSGSEGDSTCVSKLPPEGFSWDSFFSTKVYGGITVAMVLVFVIIIYILGVFGGKK